MSDVEIKATVTSFLGLVGVSRSSRILVGCSGGPDSMCLLHALSEFHDGHLGCLYVDHGLRDTGETLREKHIVSDFAASKGVEFHFSAIGEGRVLENANLRGIGIEAAARDARYRALHDCAEGFAYNYIALGHHRDDQIETVLMRVLSGSGVDGLKGIPKTRGMIIRPLIEVPRRAIESYISQYNIPSARDSSNTSPEYLRNRVRHHILPGIEAQVPGAPKALLELSYKMGLVKDALDAFTNKAITPVREDSGYVFDAQAFEHLPAYARYRFLLGLLNNLDTVDEKDFRIPFRFFRPILAANIVKDRSKTVLRGYGAVLQRDGTMYRLFPELVPRTVYSYLFNVVPGKCINIGGITISVDVEKTGVSRQSGMCIREASLSPPIVLRNHRIGDAIHLGYGTKQVKKLAHEWKVPEPERWTMPIIEDRIGLVAVLEGKAGGRVALRDRVTPAGAPDEGGTIWVLSLSNTENYSEHAK